jgi:hypothetical protein
MKYFVLAASAALLATACATTENAAQGSAAAAATMVASAEEVERAQREGYDPNAIRCERERVIGTRLPARQVCRPEWEWRAIQRGANETMDHIQRQGVPINSN